MKVLITGATSGIGRQLVADYLQAGDTVIACGRNQEKLAKLMTDFSGHVKDGRLSTLTFDITDNAVTVEVLQQATDIDCAILNAGVCEYIDDIGDIKGDLFKRVFDANYFGVVHCVEGLLPQLKKGSRLVIIDSMARLFPFTRAEAYASSKAAVHYLSNTLKIDLAPQGIYVTSVSPGFVETPLTDVNDFQMPMRISVTEASRAIRSGITKGKQQIYFPKVFGWILRLLNKLPLAWQLTLSKQMKKDT